MAHINKETLKYAYEGIDEMAQNTPGGQAGLQFWFGLVGTLYQTVFLNASSAVNNLLGVVPAANRFSKLQDGLLTMGNPYGVASYLSYASNASLGAGLYALTDKWELSNLDYSFGEGTVARGQTSEFGAGALDNPGKFNINKGKSLQTASLTTTTAHLTVAKSDNWSLPESEDDPKVEFGANNMDDMSFQDRRYAKDQELEAIQRQKENAKENHGAMSVIDDKDEIEDDGSET